ncbi:hypothetical protein BCR44DRAFT_50018 [Catenaria anguillulae PL171]|uniref:Uncharacterized protein n=1 Tax=Catenaria anguillulae PL171 TaxID=765915 RepID=A0A1Y2HVQ4_9FUNG|nr:hypothetical protein BCR44DRAFT_50018 [Catenaria anguillulae PL171]
MTCNGKPKSQVHSGQRRNGSKPKNKPTTTGTGSTAPKTPEFSDKVTPDLPRDPSTSTTPEGSRWVYDELAPNAASAPDDNKPSFTIPFSEIIMRIDKHHGSTAPPPPKAFLDPLDQRIAAADEALIAATLRSRVSTWMWADSLTAAERFCDASNAKQAWLVEFVDEWVRDHPAQHFRKGHAWPRILYGNRVMPFGVADLLDKTQFGEGAESGVPKASQAGVLEHLLRVHAAKLDMLDPFI